MENPQISLELNKRMEAKGLNPTSLAREAGLKETYVRDILRGKSIDPGIASVGKICAVLDCSLDDILAGSGGGRLAIVRIYGELTDENQQDVLKYAVKMRRLQDVGS